MIKKFNEFIEEGFLSKTINRSKSGEERLEDSLWTQDSMFQIIGFDEYYCSPDPEGVFIDIFHKPNQNPLVSFSDLDMKSDCFTISPWSEIDTVYNEISGEEKTLINSAKFKNAVNKTIEEIVPDDYYMTIDN